MTATGYVSTTGDTRKVNKSGDTMTGELTLPDSSPDQALNAASKGYVDAVAATKAALAHAAQHAAAGGDPVTLTQAQVTGLVSALAALAPLAGAHFTGDVTVDGYTTLQGGQFNSDFAAFGSMTLIGTGKRVRFRPTGGDVDVEGGGKDVYVSVWSGEDFSGTQHTYLRLEYNAGIAHAVGTWVFSDSPFGGGHTLTGTTAGFYGAAPVAQQTVTGSRGGNAALASLLSKLASLGLIVDGTSA
ncbi:hypothetical protein [Streptomyces sp. BK340]|uniref:hypothetical protein n=1 Tax=Streptomyces sp. BK340 TaxID=2572903 RepID=UPI00119D40BE|nr:hypothetical protein [Streptomyces sp. BK340]TVZ96518.1 hypothetical protein FB157_103429 [Streptomyces sp. BK340]